MSRLETNADKAYYHNLPKVSFRVITDDKSLFLPAGVHSEQSRSYGYNDFSLFERPEHYIRYIEPIESELAVQVEYDMDEQDQEWLDRVNAERKKDQLGPVTYEVFEIIMDKLEKEWFHLIKRIPQPATHLPVEDSKCSICDDGEGENSNAIVFCDGCNLAVHQDCYGVPYIPEGQWLCRKCTVSPENPVSCLFCPNEGGAFKQTSTGHWAHLLCAIWIPELGVGNAIYMEPVDGVEQVPKNRWKLVCSFCKEKVGACIQCDNRNCFTAFHVTCARQAGQLMSMKSINSDGQLRAYCDKHLPPDWKKSQGDEDEEDDESYQETNDDDEEDEDEDEDDGYDQPVKGRSRSAPKKRANSVGQARKQASLPPPTTKTAAPTLPGTASSQARTVMTKTARAHAKSYRPGPPIVPHAIVQKLLDYIGKVTIRKKVNFVERLCKYWSLKREARRGAPLLKRLHLEPWTASNGGEQQSDAEKAKKLQFLTQLRNDLEKVRMLAEQTRKREKEKLRSVQLIKHIVDSFIFPHYAVLSLTLQKIRAMDRGDMFLQPVSRLEVPDYYEVIKEPMCWTVIEDKLERNAYVEIAEFKRDIFLVVDNAMMYNKSETTFHRTAARIKKNVQPLLEEVDKLSVASAFRYNNDDDDNDKQQLSAAPLPNNDHIGDLEPSELLLQSLSLPDPEASNRDFLSSIFTFELERPRLPSPPPELKKKRIRPSLSSKQRWEEREAKRKEMTMKGSTLPRSTRATRAIADAFAHEAGIETTSGVSTPVTSTSVVNNEVSKSESTDVPVTPRRTRTTRVAALASNGRISKQKRSDRSEDVSGVEQGQGEDRGKEREDDEGENEVEESVVEGSPAIKPLSRPQRGVAGIQSVNVLSDRERRERERGLDLVAQDISSRELYSRFNIGWILPEGQKRRRSDTGGAGASKTLISNRPHASSSVKREGTATTSSIRRRPSSSTAATILAETPSSSTRGRGETGNSKEPSSMNISNKRKIEIGSSLSPPPDESEGDERKDREEKDDGEEGVEDRRQTTSVQKRKRNGQFSKGLVLKRRRLDDAKEAINDKNDEEVGEDSDMTPIPEEKTIPIRARARRDDGARTGKGKINVRDEAKEDREEEEEEEVDVKPVNKRAGKEKSKSNRAKEDSDIAPGVIVWAKVPSYPFFPGEIIDSESPIIPDAVLEQQGAGRNRDGDEEDEDDEDEKEEYLVRFFDRTRSFGWVTREKIVLLGGPKDVNFLAGKNFKSSSMKKSCTAAYRDAMAAKSALE